MPNGFLEAVVKETARMSWPGEMNNFLKAGAKAALQKYQVDHFPIQDFWNGTLPNGLKNYDAWHQEYSASIRDALSEYFQDRNFCQIAVARKLLNTFMHQLLKYEQCSWLRTILHLPLDRKVFRRLRAIAEEYDALAPVAAIIRNNPYSLGYHQYMPVQEALECLLEQVNPDRHDLYLPRARIELNAWLWA